MITITNDLFKHINHQFNDTTCQQYLCSIVISLTRIIFNYKNINNNKKYLYDILRMYFLV